MKENTTYKSWKKIRRTWDINPVERVVPSKKEYDRQKAKKQMKEIIDEELSDDLFGWYNDPIDNNIE
jgi:hypothetical protein